MPCILALLGVGVLFYAEYKVSADLHHEEDLLLAMGIDVRNPNPAMNAYNDYMAALNEAKARPQKGFIESDLDRLEQASYKQFVAAPGGAASGGSQSPTEWSLKELSDYIHGAAYRAAMDRNWRMLDRLYSIELGYDAQLLASNQFGYGYGYGFSTDPPLEFVAYLNSDAANWMRKKLESPDSSLTLRGSTSRLFRHIRFTWQKIRPQSSVKMISWWQKAIQAQTTFKQSTELAVLRHFRKVTEALRAMPPVEAIEKDPEKMFEDSIAKEKSMAAEVVLERIGLLKVQQWHRRNDYRTFLIKLDLNESRKKGLPPVPTWSKPYWRDPATGAPLRFTLKGGEVLMIKGGK